MSRYVDTFRVRLVSSGDPLEREWQGQRVRVYYVEDCGRMKWVETLEVDKAERKRALIVRSSVNAGYLDRARARGKEQGIPVFLGTV